MKTLKEIANICNVSISTVSLAINKPHKISGEVRQKIYSVIHEHGYEKTDKVIVKNIGLCINNISKYFGNEYYNDVLEGIFEAAADKKLNIKILKELNVDYSEVYGLQGFLFVGKTASENYKKAEQFKIPVINCGHPTNAFPNVSSIYHERRSSTKLILDFVLSCGHRNIAVVMGDDPEDSIQKEFLDTIAENNPYFDKQLVFQADYENIHTVEIIFNRIISMSPKITAIICVNDLIAYYIYNCADKYNMKIPEAISVTGFDGIAFPRYVKRPEPTLTTVMGDRRQLGYSAVDLLINRVKNPSLLNKNNSVLVPGYLSIGNSVARI